MLKTNNSIGKIFRSDFEEFYIHSNKTNLNKLKNQFKLIQNKILEKGNGFLIIKNFENSKKKFEEKIYLFEKFTKLVGQNNKNEKIIKVQPRKNLLNKFKKKVKKKLRYHQTNLGGSIHSDGPQLFVPPRYIIMACLEQSNYGGESILTNTQMIYEDLKNKNNEILKILKSKFLFERRGFGKNKTFLKPIFEKNGKKTKFRYLRDYIESAYKLKNIKIKKSKVTALDYLDKLLNQKKFQKNYKLKAGDLIILNNKIFAHGRKTFRVSKNINRTLLRAWIK